MILNRSFSRRIGKSLSTSQKHLLEFNLPKYIFSKASPLPIIESKPIILEIGFGMGEHLIHQAKLNPNSFYIGAEPYLNGVANVLKLAKENEIENFLLWPDDLDIILEHIPASSLHGIYILFPDPWPKRKQHKKRILNKERLEIFKSKLVNGGFLVFASDIEDYFQMSLRLILSDSNFKLIDQEFSQPHNDYIMTKYHQKANKEGRTVKFLKCKLCN